MQSAAHAYGKVAKETSSPRELEASLLLKAAARLQAVRDGWGEKNGELADALLYNRKLWSIFLTEATDNSNPLPKEVRQIEHLIGRQARAGCAALGGMAPLQEGPKFAAASVVQHEHRSHETRP